MRNDTLDRKAAELNEKLEAMSAQYKQAVSDSKEKERQLNEQGSDCARLRDINTIIILGLYIKLRRK